MLSKNTNTVLYLIASKRRAETNVPVNMKYIFKGAALTVVTFGLKRIGWKEKENKNSGRLSQGAITA